MSENQVQPEPLKFSTIEEAIEAYVEMRDALRLHMRAAKQKEDEMKFFLDRISMWLLEKGDELGVDSFASKRFGTAYRHKKTSYRVGNWDDFIEFIKETDNFQLLEKRVAKRAAAEVHEAEKAVPPGLEYTEEYEFLVQRAKGSGRGDEDE